MTDSRATSSPRPGSPVVDSATTARIQRRRTIAAIVAGTVIEWYDFALYGLAAALVFAPLYFPGAGSLGGVLAALGTFAVGLGVRPLGGLVFAHFGDRLGRKPMMLVTLILMGVSTTLIGALPTADAIGIWAPVLLVLLRCVQGAGAGAEFAGAITMVAERSDSRRGALSASYPSAAIYIGTGIATVAFTALSAMPEEAFLAWGWRLPFLASAVIVVVAAYLRLRVAETTAFQKARQSGEAERAPVLQVFRHHGRHVLCAMGVFSFILPWYYVVQVFVLSYVIDTLGVPSQQALLGLLATTFLTIPALLGFGRLADRVGRKPVLVFGALFGIAFPFPMFWLLETRSPWLVGLAMLLGIGIVQGATVGTSGAMLAEIFPTRFRWSGIAVSREIPAALIGGTAPLVAAALLAWTGHEPWSVAGYLMLLSVVGLISILAMPETLRPTGPAEL
ncbi:MFS transporter [Streptomyces sp. LHD-70]|uniref:MFS transporter n=1 Tax=Streptomyces sp. LHD-70 TaxID=3072140 RepID=UPI00280E6531|nr:MFS transporter [Streptomyces sp. LHD-70]MDQ8708101.1 MFS transporter [Streptomyces sp. LHD-70]